MSPLDVADKKVADPHDGTVAYVPPLQRTAGQPEPIAAHGGLSYMAFDRDGDAGTAVALDDALAEIASGESQRLTEMIEKAPPGPIKTKWGIAFRSYDECVEYIRQSNSIKAPPGGVALPLPYTVYERRATRWCRPTPSGATRRALKQRRSCARTSGVVTGD